MPDPIKLLTYAACGWLPGGRRSCIACGHAVWRFMPYGAGSRGLPPLMRALDVVGSDVDHFECPRCGAHDRERHLLLYFEAAGLFAALRGAAVLHFAPEKHLSRRIVAAQPARHVRCDLFPASPDVERVDMLAMQFPDASFDMVIANHVLEHVDDDGRAVAEIRRVLKPGGHAVLQTPFSRMLHATWQDDGIRGEDARLQAYGQGDHARLFGRDLPQRIASAGLAARVRSHAELLPEVDPVRHGVNPDEPFLLFERVD